MDEEIWKPVKGYEGLYEVSSFGRVKSLSRKVRRSNGHMVLKEKILHPKDGEWPAISLCRNNHFVGVNLKKIVAQAFLPNPTGCRYLIELDGNKHNCRVDNLVWRRTATVCDGDGKRVSNPRKIYFPLSDLGAAVEDMIRAYAADKAIAPDRVWDSVRRRKWSRLAIEKS